MDTKKLLELIPVALANMQLVNYLADPARQHWPNLNMWWLQYVSLVTGMAISIVSKFNIFPATEPITGLILTGLLLGAGSKFIYDYLDKSK
jgi:hypothetical protein